MDTWYGTMLIRCHSVVRSGLPTIRMDIWYGTMLIRCHGVVRLGLPTV